MNKSIIRFLIQLSTIISFVAVLFGCQGGAVSIIPTKNQSGGVYSSAPILPSFSTPTQSTITCPVSQPNLTKSPDDYFIPVQEGFGNAEENIFTLLWPSGKVIFTPQLLSPDGTLGMKWPWYRTIPGDVHITGRRLDATVPPMPEIILRGVKDGYGEVGFEPSGLTFPTVGCWEVTAKVQDASLTFVTLVLKVQ